MVFTKKSVREWRERARLADPRRIVERLQRAPWPVDGNNLMEAFVALHAHAPNDDIKNQFVVLVNQMALADSAGREAICHRMCKLFLDDDDDDDDGSATELCVLCE